MKRRVVITGMGVVSPLGHTVHDVYTKAIRGISGISQVTAFDTQHLDVRIAAQVKDFDGTVHLSKQEIRRQDLFSQYAVYASCEAYKDAKLDDVDHQRMGVILGTGMGGMITFANSLTRSFESNTMKMPPMFIPMVIPNMASGNISIKLGASGHTSTVATACAAGSHAIGDAYRMIQHGYQDVMITGGAEAAVNPYTLAGFSALNALSTEPNPAKACRPFDKNRNGFIMGEGAGILVLEELNHAKKRGALIYAEICGYGSTSDAFHITAPNGDGATRAIRLALQDSNIKPHDVDYINAHGTSTRLNDQLETQAIKAVFKEHASKVAISSTKSVHGHMLGATGAVEAILCVQTIREGLVPPTINYETPDPDCDLDYVPNYARTREISVAMSNSFGFGGHNSVLVFRKYGEDDAA